MFVRRRIATGSATLTLTALVACAAPTTPSPPPGAPRVCIPGWGRCDGSTLTLCNEQGSAFDNPEDCADYGSADNPGICGDVDCAAGACCSLEKPFVAFTVEAPLALSGQSHVSAQTKSGQIVEGVSDGVFAVRLTAMPSNQLLIIAVSFARAQFTPGDVIPASGHLTLTYGHACTSATGAITWISDEPSWSVAVDGACDQTPVRARFSGNL